MKPRRNTKLDGDGGASERDFSRRSKVIGSTVSRGDFGGTMRGDDDTQTLRTDDRDSIGYKDQNSKVYYPDKNESIERRQ